MSESKLDLGPYVKGDSITLDPLPLDTFIFHAGTTFSGGTLKTSGGRVIASTSTASTLKDAVSQAYKGISSIKFSNMVRRRPSIKQVFSAH